MEQKFKASMIVCCHVLLNAMSFSHDYFMMSLHVITLHQEFWMLKYLRKKFLCVLYSYF